MNANKMMNVCVRAIVMTGVMLAAVGDLRGEGVKFVNGDFEQYDSKGRPVGWELDKLMKAGRGLGHNANGGLVWESATQQVERISSARQRVDGFVPGDCFTLSALMRRDGFRKGGIDGYAIALEWYDDKDTWIRAPRAHGKAGVSSSAYGIRSCSGADSR